MTFDPPFLDSSGNETNGVGVDLYEILMTIQEHPLLREISGVQDHFWNMFVVDALIGNPDRNNSNQGVIVKRNGEIELAPVYDNGNCLNCKWDDDKMRLVLEDKKRLESEAFSARRCIFELEGEKLNPYHLIETMEYEVCNVAVKNITSKLKNSMTKIEEMFIDETIELREDLPEGLQNDFKELRGYYDADDWFQFDNLFEVVEASVKAYYLAGKISREDLNCIFKKYGIL